MGVGGGGAHVCATLRSAGGSVERDLRRGRVKMRGSDGDGDGNGLVVWLAVG